MRNKQKCEQCECYLCNNNNCCLECQSCVDNDYFVNADDSECPHRIENTDLTN